MANQGACPQNPTNKEISSKRAKVYLHSNCVGGCYAPAKTLPLFHPPSFGNLYSAPCAPLRAREPHRQHRHTCVRLHARFRAISPAAEEVGMQDVVTAPSKVTRANAHAHMLCWSASGEVSRAARAPARGAAVRSKLGLFSALRCTTAFIRALMHP